MVLGLKQNKTKTKLMKENNTLKSFSAKSKVTTFYKLTNFHLAHRRADWKWQRRSTRLLPHAVIRMAGVIEMLGTKLLKSLIDDLPAVTEVCVF